MRVLWPHQESCITHVEEAIDHGERRVCVQINTGGGKTECMCRLIDEWSSQGLRTVLYTNRRLLISQLSRVLDKHGIDHGRRAAGYSEDGSVWPVQISSIQTENSRVFKKATWSLHDAHRVVIDEAHIQAGDVAKKIIDQHVEEGAAVVGFTATPLDIGDIYTKLLCEGSTSSLRACGALVPALHYGPDEPDLRKIPGKLVLGKDLTEKQQVSAIMRDGIFGRVSEWYKKLNPNQKPTILFAPGVRESIWFADQFMRMGVKAAHIDGDCIWVNGDTSRSTQSARDKVLDAVREGDIKVICNRFVLREGLDLPEVSHLIFATVFGALGSYLQSGGRGLRACAGKEHVVIQDHGGNWHRHGSLNADREWKLEYTSHLLSAIREDRLRAAAARRAAGLVTERFDEREPCRCPECGLILGFIKCPCGYVVKPGVPVPRPVIQSDGALKVMHGDIYKPRRLYTQPNGPSRWKQMYWRSRNKNVERTFKAAAALFAAENFWGWPDPTWPFMPLREMDWYKLVRDVPMDRLVPEGPKVDEPAPLFEELFVP